MKTRRDVLVLTVIAALIAAASAAAWVLLVRFPSDGVRLDTSANVRERERRSMIAVFPESPAEKAGMRTGDTVFRIDGIDVYDTERLRAHFRSSVGQRMVTSYLVYRPTGPAHITVQRRPAGQFIPYRKFLLEHLVMAIPYVLVGMFTHWKRPGDPRARLLNVVCIVFASASIAPLELLFAVGESRELFGAYAGSLADHACAAAPAALLASVS